MARQPKPRPPLAAWRLYPGPTNAGLYVKVRIYESRFAFLHALTEEDEADGDSVKASQSKPYGRAESWQHYDSSGRLGPCFGQVSFYQGELGSEVVSHELAHVAFAYMSRKHLIRAYTLDVAKLHPKLAGAECLLAMPMDREELFCYALGRMMARFVRRAVRLGLYDEEGI